MRALDASDILTLWERGARRHPLDRSVLMAARARPEWPAGTIADRPLGHVTAALLELRAASFGGRIDSHVACSHCGARLQLALDTGQLVQPEPAAGDAVAVAGRRLRAPALRDLAAVAGASDSHPDAGRAARALLARCTLHGADDAPVADDTLRACEAALETLDPNADIALAVHCAICGGASSAQLDAGVLLWDEIDARARALLAEVHALASAYGWSEDAILALDPARRASYLAMVGA
jgi:hypothetical protein